ncbi:MAG TPA: DciA family protein [Mycobacteriales bacterium]|nr:DciA family protein [Mycobacteriales bacterium]
MSEDAQPSGADLVRAALERAQADARDRQAADAVRARAGASADARAVRTARRKEARASAERGEPTALGELVAGLVGDRGWDRDVSVARVTACWETVAGADVAAHSRPVSLRDGTLTLEASSTAWATQLRLLAPTLLARIADEVGSGLVTQLRIHGPAAPSWRRGPLSVRGQGPRDTYG